MIRPTRVALALLAAVTALAVVAPANAAVLVDDAPVAGWRVNGETYAVRIVNGIAYVGGSFTQAIAPNGTTRPRANLAAFNARTGALVEGFRADANGPVRALVSDGTTLYVGGSYSTIGGLSRSRLAAVDVATGAVRTGFVANANSNVYGLDLRAGRLFLGGSFSMVNTSARNRAAAVNPTTGAVDATWNPGADATILAVRANPAGTTVYLAGSFTNVGGAARTGLAAVNATTGAAQPQLGYTFRPTLALDMNESGTRLFAAVGGAGNQAAAWDTSSRERLWRQTADGDVQAVTYHRDTVYFGFHESFQGNGTLRLLAANAADGALDPNFRPTFDRFWGIHALSASEDILAGAGDFTNVSGVAAQGIVLFPPNNLPPPPPPPVTVEYAGGGTSWRFLDTGATPAPAWTGAGFDDSTWRAGRPQLGFGDGDETTIVSFGPDPNRKHVTTYFRTSFTVGNRPTSVTLSLLADDGAVVYVNGVEVARDNMPAGAIAPTTLAATNRSGTGENQFRSFTVDPARLVSGTNVIAVEVHQDAVSSSDLGLDVRLTAQVPA